MGEYMKVMESFTPMGLSAEGFHLHSSRSTRYRGPSTLYQRKNATNSTNSPNDKKFEMVETKQTMDPQSSTVVLENDHVDKGGLEIQKKKYNEWLLQQQEEKTSADEGKIQIMEGHSVSTAYGLGTVLKVQ